MINTQFWWLSVPHADVCSRKGLLVVPELRPWRAARPSLERLARLARTVRPKLAHAAGTVTTRVARIAERVTPRVARITTAVKPGVARITGAIGSGATATKAGLTRAGRATASGLARAAAAAAPGRSRAAAALAPLLARLTAFLGPYAARLRPHAARLAAAVRPPLTRLVGLTRSLPSRTARLTTVQVTAVAATVGLALAAGTATLAGPWDSGQRTAERTWAASEDGRGGTGTTAESGSGSGDSGAPEPAPSAPSVLTALTGVGGTTTDPASAPDARTLADALTPLLKGTALGNRRTASVVDVATGKQLYGMDAGAALTPASTTKIATAVAALTAVGADHRLTTRAVLEPDTKEVVLVGGGDPTLTARKDAQGWASLRTLAAETAAALKKRHLDAVTLSYDTSLYSGASLHPIGVNDNLAPVTPLMADEGRLDDSSSGTATRASDPAAEAARQFGELLEAAGIKTSSPGLSQATGRAEDLAAVQSPPLSAVVERMLTNSDNDIAEALARQTAIATGGRASFAGGATAIGAQLKKLGLPVAGAEFHDGSGLNRDDKLTARLLTSLLTLAGAKSHPDLRPVLTGLPVAGFTGTLSARYESAGERAGTGLVRAKTGSLTGVNTLAGTVVDADGRLLAFAFLTSESMDATAARDDLDRVAATLAACGCRHG
ncbi:D-alanyl-D-alanine carboxypeptidase/D-alanyl-D-alanine-endopeptidase [Actinobacteria bacterium OK074]|nr:D-alanyl-D-alanine carboxypeptidase/D-alanyl-D-alanine-endopeptidase [Actinobacteria bacterium OK074]